MGNRTPSVRKGRGATSNDSGRYEALQRTPFDDGWTANDDQLAPLKTSITDEQARSIISRNTSPDLPFDQSINPYQGCEHGCVYCFARPTHAYRGLSPGLDFETKLFAKTNAAQRLAAELCQPSYRCKVITLGANTDPYQPAERQRCITRSILEVLAKHRHPVTIITKSALIERDIDILADMARLNLVSVHISVTSLDRHIIRLMEPRTTAPQRRIEAITALSAKGIPTGVLVAPLIPVLTDHEMEAILEASAQAGIKGAGYVLLRLPLEVKQLFVDWLEAHFPLKAAHVMSIVAASRGGKAYDAAFGTRMTGTGQFAQLLQKRFNLACKRLGLNAQRLELNTELFQPHPNAEQLSLF